jgi:hypothetical protein
MNHDHRDPSAQPQSVRDFRLGLHVHWRAEGGNGLRSGTIGRTVSFAGLMTSKRSADLLTAHIRHFRSDYLRTLTIWETHFPSEQIFVGFYDDKAERPAEILRAILRFLGYDPSLGVALEELQKRVHISKEKEMPAAVQRYLAAKYRDDLATLAARFGSHPKTWLTAAEAVL